MMLTPPPIRRSRLRPHAVRARVAAGALMLLAGCSPLGLLNGINRLTPGDRGVDRAAEGVAYGADARQRLDVWRPKAEGDARPVILFFYGGGWSHGRRQDYAFAGRALAARGFVVVVPDYRLAPAHPFPAFVEDGAAAIRWTRDHVARLGGDPARISVMGHSAGAHIAAMLALDGRWLAAAGVPAGTIRAGALLAGPYDFLPLTAPQAVVALANWPRPEETQPIAFARADAPPLWLASGDADRIVSVNNSRALAARLRAKGAPVTLREYQGLSHEGIVMALSKTFRGRAPVLAEATAFLLDAAMAEPKRD
ncbi:acetyl esterase/lipase [Sphingomonas jejuensis]|uniref:Acetyl esterase/lipase n=1 Tax=Sphingomonas jejuensis TaxID=904715 RepID=A0ABX0XRI0_9SPHN|nr:alpha/beta hydrolase [Sphingomonas jejuensis]NJC35286.1 acetyl esterase/lipase [Sphingomonas jejuensis]